MRKLRRYGLKWVSLGPRLCPRAEILREYAAMKMFFGGWHGQVLLPVRLSKNTTGKRVRLPMPPPIFNTRGCASVVTTQDDSHATDRGAGVRDVILNANQSGAGA